LKAINLLVRFLLELCALAAFAYAGYHAPLPEVGKIALAIVAPVAFAVLWGLFAGHKAKYPAPEPWKSVVGFLFLELAALSLALAGQVELAIAFASTIAGNVVLLRLWES
jgi:Protein of unknown function (DUF2568)